MLRHSCKSVPEEYSRGRLMSRAFDNPISVERIS